MCVCLGFVYGGLILVMRGFSGWTILVVEGVFGFEWAVEMGLTANLGWAVLGSVTVVWWIWWWCCAFSGGLILVLGCVDLVLGSRFLEMNLVESGLV